MKILAIIRAILLTLSMALFLILYAFSRVILKHTVASSFRLRRRWLKWMGWPILGLSVEVKGSPIEEPAVYVCNHRSFSDPIILCKHLDAFVIAKAEIANYPVINKGAEVTGIIYVDRGNRDSRLATRDTMAETLNKGLNILVYPEGTVSDSQTIIPYKKGPFRVAAKVGVPVVPVVLEYRDTKDLWVRFSLIKQYFRQFSAWKTEAKMQFGPAFYSTNGDEIHQQVEAYTKKTILEMQEGWSRASFHS